MDMGWLFGGSKAAKAQVKRVCFIGDTVRTAAENKGLAHNFVVRLRRPSAPALPSRPARPSARGAAHPQKRRPRAPSPADAQR